MILPFSEVRGALVHDVCVVGSGPIGLAVALTSAAKGLRVLLLESGLAKPASSPELDRAFIEYPATHAVLKEATCRALGGTSHWWGGRCIPLDPIDFENRDTREVKWPVDYGSIADWYEAAAAFLQCGPAEFSGGSPWNALVDLRIDQCERWCPNPNIASVHRRVLEESLFVTAVLGATVVDLRFSDDTRRVTGLTAAGAGRRLVISTPLAVIACGGVQTPRLLLSVQRKYPELFGGKDGPLGRFYMGHLFGKIADLVFDDPRSAYILNFHLDKGCYVRRRFTFPAETQRREQLLNISFAAGNASIHDPSHRNGALSLIWLALASPFGKRLLPNALLRMYLGEGPHKYRNHLMNVARTFVPTMIEGAGIFWDKYMKKPGKPSIFLYSSGGRYSLHYHSEQSPSRENRVTLADEKDVFGVPLLKISFQYCREDAEQIVRAHEALDRALRANRIGSLEFKPGRQRSVESVLAQARDGMHQIGAARMSCDRSMGVVDANCQVHGVDNLFLASTCVFPSSGNANPTFTGVALAIRLADHIAASQTVTARGSYSCS